MARHNPHRAEYTKKRKSAKLKAADKRNRQRSRANDATFPHA